MKSTSLSACVLVSFIVMVIGRAAGAENASSEERIGTLIRQLGAEDCKSRAAAAAELKRFGKQALPALKEASLHGDPEIAAWAMGLVDHAEGRTRRSLEAAQAQLTQQLLEVNGRVMEVRLGGLQAERIIIRKMQDEFNGVIRPQLRGIDDLVRVQKLQNAEERLAEIQRRIQRPMQLELKLNGAVEELRQELNKRGLEGILEVEVRDVPVQEAPAGGR